MEEVRYSKHLRKQSPDFDVSETVSPYFESAGASDSEILQPTLGALGQKLRGPILMDCCDLQHRFILLLGVVCGGVLEAAAVVVQQRSWCWWRRPNGQVQLLVLFSLIL